MNFPGKLKKKFKVVSVKAEILGSPKGKGGRCVELKTLPLHVPNICKSDSLHLLDPSGSVQDSKGIV
jgi:hypothetical protein